MINKKKYSFRTYSDRYKRLFFQEKLRIKKILPKSKIEHIGSTSVPGLGGKGIVDVLVAVPKNDIPRTIKILQKHKYDYRPFGGDKGRKFFQKIIRYARKERRIHIQLTYHNSRTWKSSTSVRDYLIRHPDKLREYERIKQAAVRYAKGEGKRYREYKDAFLKRTEKAAMQENGF